MSWAWCCQETRPALAAARQAASTLTAQSSRNTPSSNSPTAKTATRNTPTDQSRRRGPGRISHSPAASIRVSPPDTDNPMLYGNACRAVRAPRSLVSLCTKLKRGSRRPAATHVRVLSNWAARPRAASLRTLSLTEDERYQGPCRRSATCPPRPTAPGQAHPAERG